MTSAACAGAHVRAGARDVMCTQRVLCSCAGVRTRGPQLRAYARGSLRVPARGGTCVGVRVRAELRSRVAFMLAH
eukprot:4487177-Pleurochrysis_carterae.AAC.1